MVNTLDARRSCRERAAVGIGLRRIDELARRARDAVEKGARRRDGRGRRQVGHPGREEARLGGGLRDLLDRARFGRVRAP